MNYRLQIWKQRFDYIIAVLSTNDPLFYLSYLRIRWRNYETYNGVIHSLIQTPKRSSNSNLGYSKKRMIVDIHCSYTLPLYGVVTLLHSVVTLCGYIEAKYIVFIM